MPSARVRGTVLAGIAGLALSAMFGFAPAASADTGSSPATLGLLGNTVGYTLGGVSSTVGGLTEGLTGALTAPAARGPAGARVYGAAHASVRAAHHKRHAKKATKHRHHSVKHRHHHTSGTHPVRTAHRRPASSRRQITAAQDTAFRRAATSRSTTLTAFDSTPTPPQNPGLLGGLLGGLTSLVNGTVAGVTGVVGGATHVVGQLLGGGRSSSGPPSSAHHPPPSSPPGSGSHKPSGPGSPNPPPATQHASGKPSITSSGGNATPRTRRPSGRALPAPNDVPSLISGPSQTVVPTTRPEPTPSVSSQIAEPVVPVSLTGAPGGWVLFAAVGLFTIAVVFMVLGAGYRGRRTR